MLKKRRTLLYVLSGFVVLAVGAFAFAYFVLFPTDSPDKFTLGDTAATPAATASATATAAAGTTRWAIAAGSEAGYRVREKLAFLPAKNDAVGRTSAITGEAESTGEGDALTITEASFKIDVSTLTSDQDKRDQRIHSIGIESDRFPTATFALAEPIALTKTKVDATGDLTLHGVKKRVTIPLQVRQSGSSLEAVGSLSFPWGDFGMTAPSVAGFVSVEDTATLEFDLKLAQG
ncbi:MAG TPA: YceI family protein [Solirubrobacter sp.]